MDTLEQAKSYGGVQIYDADGELRDWAWLAQHYGAGVRIEKAPAGPAWRITKIQEIADHTTGWLKDLGIKATSTCTVTLLLPDGRPAMGVPILWNWRDAGLVPDAGPANGVPGECWPGRGDVGETNIKGQVGFCMGSGAYYFPNEPPYRGPHNIWKKGTDTASDVFVGEGMLGGTNHFHLDLTLQWDPGDETPEPPTPEPPLVDDFKAAVIERLDKIIVLLEKAVDLLSRRA
jgi:hypothetical protein